MEKVKEPWYFHIKMGNFEVLGIYRNIITENSKTIFGLRLFDALLIGLCKNERDYFMDTTFLLWPNVSGEVK
jgi:hypothetical protein